MGWGTLFALLLVASRVASAQPSGPVRFALAVEAPVRHGIELTGSVESLSESVISSEVEGLVERVDVLPGQAVRRGQRLARLRTTLREIDRTAAESDLAVAQAQLELAESQLRRDRDLFDDGVISQGELDDSIRELNRRKGETTLAEANLRRIVYQLDRSDIVAPFTGVVSRRHAEVGQWIDAGGAVVDLVALDPLEVVVQVPEQYFTRLVPGASVDVSLPALPDTIIGGEIVRVVPRADPQARTFAARVRVSNPDSHIGVGMLATVSLPLGAPSERLLVPKDAVIQRGSREYLFRVGAGDVVEQVDVTTVQGHGNWFELRPGPVRPGDRVVTRGNERLTPGQAVQSAQLQDYALPGRVGGAGG